MIHRIVLWFTQHNLKIAMFSDILRRGNHDPVHAAEIAREAYKALYK